MAVDPIKVEGLREQIKALRFIGEEGIAKSIKDAGKSSAEIVKQEGSALAPRRTGSLAGSLRTFSNQSAAGVLSRLVYGNPVHWGWLVVGARHKGTLRVGTYRGIKPNPFLSEALHLKRDEVYADYEAKIDKLIKDKEIKA